MRYINEYREGDFCKGIYLCKSKQVLTARTGKTYYSLILQDKTGSVDCKVFDINSGIDEFEAHDYIEVNGQVSSFQGNIQWKLARIRKCDEGEYNIEDYMMASKYDRDDMYKELMRIMSTVKNEYLRKLISMYFVEDEDFIKRFKDHSAAKSVHHSFIGGLLQHTLGVVKACDYIAGTYSNVDRDLLLTAGLFHDVGKMDELSTFPANDYTDEGQLIGHIVMGAMMVGEKIKTIEGFPPVLANELKHCILSHHGELEFGSPKKPGLIEALALAHADNMDAKLETFTELINANKGKKEWLGYNRMFDANVRITGD